jgi:hypothetical protein
MLNLNSRATVLLKDVCYVLQRATNRVDHVANTRVVTLSRLVRLTRRWDWVSYHVSAPTCRQRCL